MAKRASKPVRGDYAPVSFGLDDTDDAATKPEAPKGAKEPSVDYPGGDILAGAEALADGKPHVGVAIAVSSGMQDSIIMIPDVQKIKKGESPIYITRPITLKFEKLVDFLKNKDITIPTELTGLLNDTSVSCDAFYFTRDTPGETPKDGKPKTEGKKGPRLMQFRLQFTKGLIQSLTGDEDIAALFDIKGVSVRYIRCSTPELKLLTAYADELVSADKEISE